MSMREYERFVYRACHVEEDGDPVAHWLATRERAVAAGRASSAAHASCGSSAPTPTSASSSRGARGRSRTGATTCPTARSTRARSRPETEGHIRFTFPALFQGREVDDIRLSFEERRGGRRRGRARRGSFLDALLDLDDGARRLGEVAFGLNYEIDEFTSNTLFDEKIGGTMHVALGAAFKELGGRNESALHWDLVCDLRTEGEVYADGEPVWRAGPFPGGRRAGLTRTRVRSSMANICSGRYFFWQLLVLVAWAFVARASQGAGQRSPLHGEAGRHALVDRVDALRGRPARRHLEDPAREPPRRDADPPG